MCKYLIYSIGAILFSCFTTFSQQQYARELVNTLCSPEFHGRGYVNGGDSIAAMYLASEFRSIGLQPLTEDYFQLFSFSVNTFPGKMNIRLNGRTLQVGEDVLVHPASPSYVGDLHYQFVQLADLMDTNNMTSIVRKVLERGYNSIAVNLIGVPDDTIKIWRSLRNHVADLMPMIVLTDQKFIWSVAKKQMKFPIIEIKSLQEQDILSIDMEARWIETHHTRNVVAYLPAKKKTNKTIVFTAHYDHLGRLGEDTYFPGANDNASGTAMLFSLAKKFQQKPIDCNILFIAFAGEEIGLLGSKYYVEHPLLPLENMRFVINLDIVGSGEEGVAVVNGDALKNDFLRLEKINKKKKLITPLLSRGTAANSDHYYFYQAGVPAFFLYTMGPNKQYHDIYDTSDNLSLAEIDDLTQLLWFFAKDLLKNSK